MPHVEENVSPNRSCLDCCCRCFKLKKRASDVQTNENENAPVEENVTEKVPFSGDLPDTLTTGQSICISAFILRNCLRFRIDLICRKGPNTDIAFHFNPRLEQRYVVRNSFLNGRWGEEETTSARKFDFERNKKFDLSIFLSPDQFLVAVNGKHFCAYTHRLPVSALTGIEISGPVDVLEVSYKDVEVYPDEDVEGLDIPVEKGGEDVRKDVLEVPYLGKLPIKLVDGWQLEVYGRVKLLPHSFYVNLQESPFVWPHPIIPLHLNPRFSTTFGGDVFVRNSWMGEWGREEAAPGFPFAPGSEFVLVIQCGHAHYSVWVNRKLVGEFHFREKTEKITTVYIQGDVVLRKVALRKKTQI